MYFALSVLLRFNTPAEENLTEYQLMLRLVWTSCSDNTESAHNVLRKFWLDFCQPFYKLKLPTYVGIFHGKSMCIASYIAAKLLTASFMFTFLLTC